MKVRRRPGVILAVAGLVLTFAGAVEAAETQYRTYELPGGVAVRGNGVATFVSAARFFVPPAATTADLTVIDDVSVHTSFTWCVDRTGEGICLGGTADLVGRGVDRAIVAPVGGFGTGEILLVDVDAVGVGDGLAARVGTSGVVRAVFD